MVLTATGYVLPIKAGVEVKPTAPPLVQKYSPDQPRVPVGNSDGGQWTSGGGSGASSDSTSGADHNGASRPVQYAALDTVTRTDATEATPPGSQAFDQSAKPRVELASDWRGLPVNLAEEEVPNGIGHTISEHVGKSNAELFNALERKSYYGPIFDYIRYREGSFNSIENANDLVNQTLRENSNQVDLVASGQLDSAYITYRFGFITGYEAYRTGPYTDPVIRKTYAVRMVIWYDANSPRGFRIRTAFPMNTD